MTFRVKYSDAFGGDTGSRRMRPETFHPFGQELQASLVLMLRYSRPLRNPDRAIAGSVLFTCPNACIRMVVILSTALQNSGGGGDE